VNLLLDTHIWIWALGDPKRLSRKSARELENPANQLWLSPISLWEILTLSRKGRLHPSWEAEEWIERAFRQVPVEEAPLTREVVLATAKLKLGHRDPADHFLVATALIFGLTLVTADERLIRNASVPVLANR
jgi:PIN domain nuclease of toxin-antitoxin system